MLLPLFDDVSPQDGREVVGIDGLPGLAEVIDDEAEYAADDERHEEAHDPEPHVRDAVHVEVLLVATATTGGSGGNKRKNAYNQIHNNVQPNCYNYRSIQ